MSPRQAHDAARRHEATLRAYVETGTIKGAAHRLGITERAVRRRLADYCDDHHFGSLVQAVFHFGTSERGAEPPP